jgi:hypothetical protein
MYLFTRCTLCRFLCAAKSTHTLHDLLICLFVEVVYDISAGNITRAAYGGLLLEGLRLSYAQVGWIQWFTWFGPLKRNTLYIRRECCIIVCVTLFKAELNLRKVEIVQNRCMSDPFIAQGRTVILCPSARQMVPGLL